MNFTRLLKRYKEIRDIYIPKASAAKKGWLVIDYIGAYIRHGVSFNDYFGYRFNSLNGNGRKEYITLRHTRKIQRICNNPHAIDNFRDKIKFNTIYAEFLGRKWIDVNNATLEDFKRFLEDVGPAVFIKDVNGLCGIGIEKRSTTEINPEILYNQLRSNSDARFIIEQPITQTGPVAELHPWSVNTIRITTVYDTTHDKVNIMGAVLRIGVGKDPRDNLHAGGVAAHIDIDSGMICAPAFDKTNHTYLCHPDTGKRLLGFKIPDWEACKRFIINVARRSPDVRYVGWDVVVKGDGAFLLIEGNDNGDHDVQQLNFHGLWPNYQRVLLEMQK